MADGLRTIQATRSAMSRTSALHPGLTRNPEVTLDGLMGRIRGGFGQTQVRRIVQPHRASKPLWRRVR
jgi:hypothetical protein